MAKLNIATFTRSLDACESWLAWQAKHANLSLRETWEKNPRADWLLWYAARIGVDRRLIVRAACACARTALKHVPKGENRPLLAIETAERWCDGNATDDECKGAAYAAYAYAAYAAAYAYAAYAAAYAYAYAVAAASYAARSAAADADADAAASYAAPFADGADAARSRRLRKMAKLVRKHIPYSAVRAARVAYRKENGP